METLTVLGHETDLSILEYRIDSICRDAMQYQAVLPDGLPELLLEAFREVHAAGEESTVQMQISRRDEGETSGYQPDVLCTGMMGRPSFVIHQSQLEFLAGESVFVLNFFQRTDGMFLGCK